MNSKRKVNAIKTLLSLVFKQVKHPLLRRCFPSLQNLVSSSLTCYVLQWHVRERSLCFDDLGPVVVSSLPRYQQAPTNVEVTEDPQDSSVQVHSAVLALTFTSDKQRRQMQQPQNFSHNLPFLQQNSNELV